MNRSASIAFALLNVLISLVFLLAYLSKSFWVIGIPFYWWDWVGYSYVYALGLFVFPSLIIWMTVLLVTIRQKDKRSAWLLSVKLLALTILLHFAAFYTVRAHSNKVVLTLVNDSNYQVSELQIIARNNKEFFITRLEPGEAKIIDCYCARIEYPDDTGIKIAYSINGKKVEDYISRRFTPIEEKVIISITSDSLFSKIDSFR